MTGPIEDDQVLVCVHAAGVTAASASHDRPAVLLRLAGYGLRAPKGLTAVQCIRDHAQLQPGQKVLVVGASGGVGSFAVQIAKPLGAQVTGVCSTTKVDMVRALGADRVVDYTREDIADAGERYDVNPLEWWPS